MKFYTVFTIGEQPASQFQALSHTVNGTAVTFMLPNGTLRTYTLVIRFDCAEILVPKEERQEPSDG